MIRRDAPQTKNLDRLRPVHLRLEPAPHKLLHAFRAPHHPQSREARKSRTECSETDDYRGCHLVLMCVYVKVVVFIS